MSAIDDIHPPDRAKPGLVEGIVAVGAATVDEQIEVVIPSFDPNLRFGPCPWPARAGVLPQRGDRVLVFDDPQFPWVVAWWPYG